MKKVKKFGRGGDILTGIGAGLAGYGIYKALTKDKDKEDDYTRKAIEFRDSKKEAEPVKKQAEPDKKEAEPISTAKKEPSAAEKRAMAASQGRPEMGDVTSGMESDNYPVTKPKPAKKVKPKKVEPKEAVEDKPDTTKPKSVVFNKDKEPPSTKESEAKTEINKTLKAAPDLSVPKALDMKSTSKTVYGTDTTSVFQKKAAQERAEIERKAKEAKMAPKRKPPAEVNYDVMGNAYKRGGSVSSASKRADGIAMRGKTRGRVL